MYKLEAFLQIFGAARQQPGQPLARGPHAGRTFAAAQWGSAQRSHHVVLHSGARENVRTHNVSVTATEALGPVANHLVALALVNGVGQRVSAERGFLFHRPRGLRTVYHDTAGKNELPDLAAGAIDDAYGFHDPGRSSDVDLPHPFQVENARALGI